MLGQITFGFETEIAIFAGIWPDVGVSAYVFLQHGRFLAPDTTSITDIFPSSPASDVGVVVICRLVTSLHCSHWLGSFRVLEIKMIEKSFYFIFCSDKRQLN